MPWFPGDAEIRLEPDIRSETTGQVSQVWMERKGEKGSLCSYTKDDR